MHTEVEPGKKLSLDLVEVIRDEKYEKNDEVVFFQMNDVVGVRSRTKRCNPHLNIKEPDRETNNSSEIVSALE